jgi:hypothetical protein
MEDNRVTDGVLDRVLGGFNARMDPAGVKRCMCASCGVMQLRCGSDDEPHFAELQLGSLGCLRLSRDEYAAWMGIPADNENFGSLSRRKANSLYFLSTMRFWQPRFMRYINLIEQSIFIGTKGMLSIKADV